MNLSGTCATTKLVQCKNFGIYTCSVERKFHKDPEDVPDLSKEDFLARKMVVDQIGQWCEDNGKYSKNRSVDSIEWSPILYAYQVSSLRYFWKGFTMI